MAIPSTIDQITPALLTEALRYSGFGDADVATVSAERIAVGEGFLGELARLSLTYRSGTYGSGTGPATAIAKIPTTDSGLKPLGDMLDVYRREHLAYVEVIPQLQVRTPRAYYNAGDVESGAYCLVLEDIGHLVAGDHHAGGTLAQAQSAFAAAAGIHSRWWGKVDELDWVPPIDSPLNMGLQGLVEANWASIVDGYGYLLGDEVVGRLEQFVPTMCDMLVAYGALSRTLVHSDFRLDNMFFDGDELVLLDWQVIGRGDGMADLCPFISSNFDSELRRAHEEDLFKSYFRTMTEAGAGLLQFEDLMMSYRLNLNFWLVMWCNGAASKGETTQRGEELFQRMITRTCDAYVQHEAWELSGDYETHDRFH